MLQKNAPVKGKSQVWEGQRERVTRRNATERGRIKIIRESSSDFSAECVILFSPLEFRAVRLWGLLPLFSLAYAPHCPIKNARILGKSHPDMKCWSRVRCSEAGPRAMSPERVAAVLDGGGGQRQSRAALLWCSLVVPRHTPLLKKSQKGQKDCEGRATKAMQGGNVLGCLQGVQNTRWQGK